MRTRPLLSAYLRRFPPVDGIPLEEFGIMTPFSSWDVQRAYRKAQRAMRYVLRNPQPDPAVESMRRAILLRQRILIVWIFTFPVLSFCTYVLLFATHTLQAVP